MNNVNLCSVDKYLLTLQYEHITSAKTTKSLNSVCAMTPLSVAYFTKKIICVFKES